MYKTWDQILRVVSIPCQPATLAVSPKLISGKQSNLQSNHSALNGLTIGMKHIRQREGSLSYHTCCDTEPRFSRSHTKSRSIQSPPTTHKGVWRIFSNPDPHWSIIYYKKKKKTFAN
jgi:hypothetical protein